jgi:hypothetical protein
MKRYYRQILIAFLLSFFAGCGHQKKSPEVAAVVGSDTLTVSQVEMLRPDSMLSSTRVTTVMTQRALARRCRATMGGAQRDTVLTALMQQLSLRSGVEWNREATGSLFDAVCGLRALLDTAKSIEKVSSYLDSMLGRGTLGDGKKPGAFTSCRRGGPGASEIRFDSLIACVLGVSPDIGRTLEQFLASSGSGKRDTAKAAAMVKGLLFDAARTPSTTHAPGGPEAPLDNSEAVLKFRDQASIQDTIAKHQSNIRELYKKHLKLNSRLAGKVVLQFRVAADGNVVDAVPVQSQINEKTFLDGLTAYAKTIRFKPVPATAGAMRFEFPFEFTPEE